MACCAWTYLVSLEYLSGLSRVKHNFLVSPMLVRDAATLSCAVVDCASMLIERREICRNDEKGRRLNGTGS